MSYENELKKLQEQVEELQPLKTLPDEIKTINENVSSMQKSIVAMSKADCEAKGGKWDEEKGTCTLPEKTTEGLYPTEAFEWLIEDIGKNLPFVCEAEDKVQALRSVNEVLETLKTRKVFKEILNQYPALDETKKESPAPPKYPAGVYPLPTFLSLMAKLCKSDETVGACMTRLKGEEKQAEVPKTKEGCETAGGKWNEETKTCILPEKKTPTGGEALQGLGVLPSAGVGTPNLEESKANALIAKVGPKTKEAN